MHKTSSAFALVLTLAAAAPAPAAGPHVGQPMGDVASLSDADVAELLAGGGWGLAKPAELNGYPGPRHVLDLGRDLALDDGQRAAVTAVFERMRGEARRVGAAYVEAERAVDRAFRSGRIDGTVLAERLAAAGRLRDQLRHVHLAAHLETATILTERQRHLYRRLRGYDGGGDDAAGRRHPRPGAGHH